jgi:hypothetical protein
LILSLIFGAGQIVVGGIIARFSLVNLGQGIWTHARHFLLLVVSLWFIVSGTLELLVSGMETAQRLGAVISSRTFTLWRARADTSLVWVSVTLLASLLAYELVRRLRSRSRGS